MHPIIVSRSKYIVLLLLFFVTVFPAHAAGPPAPSIFDNYLLLLLLFVVILLAVIIFVLAQVLLGAADIRLKKSKDASATGKTLTTTLLLMMCASLASAQDAAVTNTVESSTIAGVSALAFYVIVSVIALEFLVILTLLLYTRMLLQKKRKTMAFHEMAPEVAAEHRRNHLSWWDRFNKLKPVAQEAELDLGHEYDGIRELNNRLPPWWLYGFYVTIIFAGIYLYRFHVAHTALLSGEEYQQAVAEADIKIKAYLKAKGDAVDENTVTILSNPEDLADGKKIFQTSCVACHLETGGGAVGPNLTDDYWLHGNDIKDIFKTIRYGINAMPQWQNSYSNKEIAKVASYVKSLHGTNPPNAKGPQGVEMKETAQGKPDSTQNASMNKSISSR